MNFFLLMLFVRWVFVSLSRLIYLFITHILTNLIVLIEFSTKLGTLGIVNIGLWEYRTL